jgi:hypothetical protein
VQFPRLSGDLTMTVEYDSVKHRRRITKRMRLIISLE